MPAKALTAEQKEDARRLSEHFKAWQVRERELGRRASQADAAFQLDFGQSAVSQYLCGTIPLNAEALERFCSLLGVRPELISPQIVEHMRAKLSIWMPHGSFAMATKIARQTTTDHDESWPLEKYLPRFKKLPERQQGMAEEAFRAAIERGEVEARQNSKAKRTGT